MWVRGLVSCSAFPFLLLIILTISAHAEPPESQLPFLDPLTREDLDGLFESTSLDLAGGVLEDLVEAGTAVPTEWGPSVGCLWTLSDLREVSTELLPPIEETKDSGANDSEIVISDPGGSPDTSIVAVGFSNDAMDMTKPILWKLRRGDTAWTYQQLPTLAGGEGEACGILVEENDSLYVVCGWSAGASADKAVIWTEDESSAWDVVELPHDLTGSAGCARDGFVSAVSGTTICGWVESSLGDTTAVLWENSGAGWVKLPLPKLAGGAKSMAISFIPGDGEMRSVVGWAENDLGDRRAVLWSYEDFWHVEELDQLAGSSQSEARSGHMCPAGDFKFLIVGSSYGLGSSRGTIWGLAWEPDNGLTLDLNDLIIAEDPPAIREAVAVGYGPGEKLVIAANGMPAQPPFYSISSDGDPRPYFLVETTVVPAPSSGISMVVLALALGGVVLFALGTTRRPRRRLM